MLATAPNGVKDRQALKIKELADALVAAGFESLDQQADALGLSRSTTWTILKAKHKNYGLSAAIISRVLRNPDLNSRVRAKVVEYVREKSAGSYGHNHAQLRRFVGQLADAVGTAPDDTILDHFYRNRASNRVTSHSATGSNRAQKKLPSAIASRYRDRSGRTSGD